MPNLKTDYKDDVFSGKRKYNQINNVDGTVSFEDVTDYAQVGDSYGAAQINETNDVVNNINNKGYKNDDESETSIADNDYFPFFDASANAKKKTLWSNIKSVLTNVFAIKNHAANSTVYGAGNANLYGHVKLSDSYASSAGAAASAVAASSKAVNDAFNTNKNSINSLFGTVTSNKTTETNHYNELKGELTANGQRIYMDYKNGKYGINTSANRGADSFVPFKSGYTIPTLWARADGDNRVCETEYTFDVSEYNYFKVQSIVSNYGIGECVFYRDSTNIGGSSLINTQIDVSSASTLKIHASGNVGSSFTTVTYTNIQVYN